MTVADAPQQGQTLPVEARSFRSILRSTSLIGGSSVINVLVGMVRTKCVAVLLGPSGVGLIGMYSNVINLATTISTMGLSSSGVREIAEAVGSGEAERISEVALSLRRSVWFLGLAGMLLMILFGRCVSEVTFKSTEYASSLRLLGLAVLLGTVASGQSALLQGTRRIADLARLGVLGAVNGTLISVPCYYLWHEAGIVPSLVLSSAATLATSWWFARRVRLEGKAPPWRGTFAQSRRLLALGIGFMTAALTTVASAYLIQVLLLRFFDLKTVGIYQSAVTLSGLLIGFVLNAMGTDYYPRVVAVAGDRLKLREMVNQQSQISVLLALPLLAAMMVLAPLILRMFYSESFGAALPILRYSLLGVLCRVFSWPLGFVIMAKGQGKVFFLTEFAGNLAHLCAVFFLVRSFGLYGAGVAFMAANLGYLLMMLGVIHALTGRLWSLQTFRWLLVSLAVMALLMVTCQADSGSPALLVVNLLLLGAISYCCLRELMARSGAVTAGSLER